MGKILLCERLLPSPCTTSIYVAFSASSVLFSAGVAEGKIRLSGKADSFIYKSFIYILPAAINISFYKCEDCAV